MNTYTYYAGGIFCNTLYTIQAKTKKEAIEKAKKTLHGITVRTCRKVK